MSRLEQSVVLVVALLALAAVVDYALYRGQFGVSTRLGTMRDAAIEQYDRFRGTPSPSESPAAGEPAPAPAGPVRSATASPVLWFARTLVEVLR